MKESYIDKVHLQSSLKVDDINNAKVECILNNYEKLKLYILDDISELTQVLEEAKINTHVFPIYALKSDHQIHYIESWFDMHKPRSKTATQAIVYAIHRSYLTYAFYFNKGIRSYLLKNQQFIQSLIKVVMSSIIVSLKKAYIALNKDDLQQVKILTACFIVYCLLGVKDKTMLMSILKFINIGTLQAFSTLFIFNKLLSYLEQQPSLIHTLALLLKWNKMASNALTLQVTRLLGNTLSFLLLTCDTHKVEDGHAVLAYKFSTLYYFYITGVIYNEANVAYINRISEHAFNTLFKELSKVAKIAHFGKC